MSESAVAPSSSHTPRVSTVPEAVIRIAGNSQDGIQAIGGFLARLAGRSEQEVMTFMTIPSTISGGPSIFQVRIGSGEVLSAGDEADVLLCFYDHSYENHISSLKRGGIVLYDSDHVEPNPDLLGAYHHVGVPISSLVVEAIEKAARKLAMKYHPDKTTDPEAPEKFLLVQKAKEILLDETKRKVIDDHREASARPYPSERTRSRRNSSSPSRDRRRD